MSFVPGPIGISNYIGRRVTHIWWKTSSRIGSWVG